MEAVPLKKAYGEGGLNLHVKNHLECIKSRNRNCNASIEIGAHIAKFSQLGNIAYRTGKKLTWDERVSMTQKQTNIYARNTGHLGSYRRFKPKGVVSNTGTTFFIQ